MARIDHIIQMQRFEMVIDQLGAILLDELSNQKLLNNYNEIFEIFKERQEPIDKSEDIVINLSINNIDYANQNSFNRDGIHNINIDVYVNGYETNEVTANDFTRFKLHKTIGLIRYIIEHDAYYNLNFTEEVIMSRYINSANFFENTNNQDGSFNRMARLELVLRFSEKYQDNQLNPLLGNDTRVKTKLTNNGFKYEYNN